MAQNGFGGGFGLAPEERKWLRSEEKFWRRLQPHDSMGDRFWVLIGLVLVVLFVLIKSSSSVFT